jgi:hypothetical protein
MEYTLAFRRVKTVAVLRSRPRNESRISTEGFAASSANIPESYDKMSAFFFLTSARRYRVMYVVEIANQFGVFV